MHHFYAHAWEKHAFMLNFPSFSQHLNGLASIHHVTECTARPPGLVPYPQSHLGHPEAGLVEAEG